MRTVDTHLLEEKMDEAVTHYINTHHSNESVHIDSNGIPMTVQEDGGGRVTIMHQQTYTTQLCRQVSVTEQVGDGPWGEELLEGPIAAIVAHLQSSRQHPTPHHKVSQVRSDVDTSVILDGTMRFNAQSLDQQTEPLVVQLPPVQTLPPLQDMKRCADTDWFTDNSKKDEQSLVQSSSQGSEQPSMSSAHHKHQSRKSLPHKKRISRKLRRNNGNCTPHQELVVINCSEEVSTAPEQEQILPDNYVTVPHTTHIPNEVRPVLICQECGEYYGEQQLKFYQHLRTHYEPQHTIIIENPVHQHPMDKMSSNCIVDNVATLPDSIVELSLENTVPKTLYQPIDKHILYTSSDKTLPYISNKLQYSMASMEGPPAAGSSVADGDKTDLYSSLDKLELYNCGKCSKTFKKQRHCEAHMREAHTNTKLEEDMGEFSEPEDLMCGISVCVTDTILPHLTVENGQVHQDHMRHWYGRGPAPAEGGTPPASNGGAPCGGYCGVCARDPDTPYKLLKEEVLQRIFDNDVSDNANFGDNMMPEHDVNEHDHDDHNQHEHSHSHNEHSHGHHEHSHGHNKHSQGHNEHGYGNNAHSQGHNENSQDDSENDHRHNEHLHMQSLRHNEHSQHSQGHNENLLEQKEHSRIEQSHLHNEQSHAHNEHSHTLNEHNHTLNEHTHTHNEHVHGHNEHSDDHNEHSPDQNNSHEQIDHDNVHNELSQGHSENSQDQCQMVKQHLTIVKKHFSCMKCSRVFTHRNSLLYHLLSHDSKKHTCRECGKGFYTHNALSVHFRQHSNVRPYKCDMCDRDFRQWSDLKYHKNSIHSDKKLFKCEYCGKEFARKYSLNLHVRIHTGEKNYKCDHCSKTFRCSSYKIAHMRTHTGDRPHKCLECEKSFRSAFDLRRHSLVHDKIRNRFDEHKLTNKHTKTKTKMIDTKEEKEEKFEPSPKKFKQVALASTARPAVLTKRVQKPRKTSKKGAPNVTVQNRESPFKTNDEFTNNVEVYEGRSDYCTLKHIYCESDKIPIIFKEENRRELAVLRPLSVGRTEMPEEKQPYRAENTDGKMQVFTQVEKSKDYSGSIVSNTQVLGEMRHLEREVAKEVRSDIAGEGSMETGFLERLTAMYNIPAV